MNRVSIETTQNVQIDYALASIGDRMLAFLIDFLIMAAYIVAVGFGLVYFGEELYRHKLFVPVRSIALFPVLLYSLISEAFMNGQTIGKKQLKIKVLRIDGSHPTLSSYLIRWILRIIDVWVSFGAAAIVTISVNERGQRLADIAAGTTVVKVKPKIGLADLKRIFLTTEDDSYQPTYDQVLTLTDNDINIIKDIISKRNKIRDPKIFNSLANKIKETLNITYEGEPLPFLRTILKDYNYLANKENY